METLFSFPFCVDICTDSAQAVVGDRPVSAISKLVALHCVFSGILSETKLSMLLKSMFDEGYSFPLLPLYVFNCFPCMSVCAQYVCSTSGSQKGVLDTPWEQSDSHM